MSPKDELKNIIQSLTYDELIEAVAIFEAYFVKKQAEQPPQSLKAHQ